MRKLVLLALLAGCHDFPKHGSPNADGGKTEPSFPDAPFASIDAASGFCSAPFGSADLTLVDGTSTLGLSVMDAGGVIQSGPFTGIPMTLSLLFVQSDAVDINTLFCCGAQDTACCPIAGAVVTCEQAIDATNAVGDHPVTIKSFQDPQLDISGTLTITKFTSPVDQPNGEIAGSISGSGASGSVSGTLDNAFCPELLVSTI